MLVVVGVVLLVLVLLFSTKKIESDALEALAGVILLIAVGAFALWALFRYSDFWQLLLG